MLTRQYILLHDVADNCLAVGEGGKQLIWYLLIRYFIPSSTFSLSSYTIWERWPLGLATLAILSLSEQARPLQELSGLMPRWVWSLEVWHVCNTLTSSWSFSFN